MSRNRTMVTGAGLAALLAIALSLSLGQPNARAADGAGKSMTVDYSDAGGMQVTFFADVTPEVRADFLKSELENYVRVFKPERDYLATPFDAAGKNLGGGMIYVAARKQVLPVESYQQGR